GRSPPAPEQPARRPGGPPARPRLPAGGGAGPLRLQAGLPPPGGRQRSVPPADGVPGGEGGGLLRAGPEPAPPAAAPGQGLRGRDGGHLPHHSGRYQPAAGHRAAAAGKPERRSEAGAGRAGAREEPGAMSERPSVTVVGGGLAGITAACDLAEAGLKVTLLEKRPFLGGRDYSYLDKRSRVEVDNGQHVFLGCWRPDIGLLKRLGVWHKAHPPRRLNVRAIDKVWGESVLRSERLAPPPHLPPSPMRVRFLSPAEKARAAYAMARIRSLDRAAHPELDDVTFADWLRAHGQTENAGRRLSN